MIDGDIERLVEALRNVARLDGSGDRQGVTIEELCELHDLDPGNQYHQRMVRQRLTALKRQGRVEVLRERRRNELTERQTVRDVFRLVDGGEAEHE